MTSTFEVNMNGNSWVDKKRASARKGFSLQI